jgi:hypothetical protein
MLHITRASAEGVAQCRCPDSLMAVPDQSETPWDGTGWQMACHRCGKAFTFGKAIEVKMTLREFIVKDLKQRQLPKELLNDPDFIDGCVESIGEMMEGLEEGKEYVYLDGMLIPTDFEGVIEFDGIFAAHELTSVPHLELKRDKAASRHLLGDPRYWNDRALPPEDDEEEFEDEEDDELAEYEDEAADDDADAGPAGRR